MRVPKRRGEELRRSKQQTDNHLTKEAVERMKKKVGRLTTIDRPAATKELQRTQEMGDLSENAAYQEAKWTLRRINSQIVSLSERIKNAIIIEAVDDGTIQIGSTVLLFIDKKEQKFEIVGSQETDPLRGRISYQSPLGKILVGKKVGDAFTTSMGGKDVVIEINEIQF